MHDAHNAKLLVVPLDDTLEDLADPRDVVLLFGLRLEWAELARDERLCVEVERPLDRQPILGDRVANDPSADAEDRGRR